MYNNRRSFGPRRNPPVKVGDILDVHIEAVGEKGDGVAKKDGFVLFVPGVNEGDNVKIKVTRVLSKVGFAEVFSGDGAEAPQEESAGEQQEESSEESGTEEESSASDSEDFGDESSSKASSDSDDFGNEDAQDSEEESADEEVTEAA